MYNEQQEERKQVNNTTVILPPIQSNNVDNIGQKRSVPWLQEENSNDNNKIKISKIEEKQEYMNSSNYKKSFVKPIMIQQRRNYTTVYNDQTIIQQRTNRPKLKLDDFNISRTLGTGSFGRVHLIQSKVNGRFYAMKVLKKTEVVRLKQVEHTNNEKHILESVAHPFLVNMWGTFQDCYNLYMIMDYVPGGELFSVLRRSQRFPDHVAKFYAAEVILAIEYLHGKDMIYRDLKPENLLLDAQGHIKITDFGFAKYVPDITWTLCGTPDYLAPEIIQSKGYGKAVDWWSLGVLIYEMLAGYPPFYDDDHLKLYEKILACKIKWPQYFDPNAKDLLKRLLTTDLTKRFGNLKAGTDDIKRHPWFTGVDFNRILARQIRAPYIPQIRGEGDASHFDKYPETQEQYGVVGQNDPYMHMFPDF
ncbi:hypothetical protein G6F57_000587 [Rhizopus arrhizus]|uniref:cAMP-dependent protein kinase n=1 Tax=Rhizopus oryzae TaxID=64495 RepID=A0A9P6XHR9_RHIOR|nr:hypothetical protein G6F23_005653 [Rhizopus arrhizus]KAG1425159.1 hypothetical protein G6F58_002052 [Rhizopus delemar]KAG0768552.1 hypothetical protein G6F24_001842 [Rhizopus arrhizus]KAG0780571.1 hypothetical protein G6F22_010012 [Rhizopus arrhizus]KAG0795775.1 hypothetical protein G6F21_001842 [Rhizopus arrhizus]